MLIEPPAEDLDALIALATENTVRSAHSGDRHYLRLTYQDGINIAFECRHQPVPEGRVCGGYMAGEYGTDFFEWFAGKPNDEVRSGLIDLWWDGFDEDAGLLWEYVTFVDAA